MKCKKTCPDYKPSCFCTCHKPEKDDGSRDNPEYKNYLMELIESGRLRGKQPRLEVRGEIRATRF